MPACIVGAGGGGGGGRRTLDVGVFIRPQADGWAEAVALEGRAREKAFALALERPPQGRHACEGDELEFSGSRGVVGDRPNVQVVHPESADSNMHVQWFGQQ